MARYALLATINRYANDRLPPLQFAERDGQVLESLLQERGFKTLHLAGQHATRERILDMLCGNVTDAQWPPLTGKDLLLFFFAGHGELVGGGYVLHGYHARPGTSIHSVPMRDVANALREHIPCQQCACIVDACRNLARPGARGTAALDEQSSRDIKAVASSNGDSKLVEMLYGCDEGQVSTEELSLQHGVLTYHIAQVIRDNECVTMEDLFDEAADRMREWLRKHRSGEAQEPQLYRPGGRRRISLFDPQVSSQSEARRLIAEKQRADNALAEREAAAERDLAAHNEREHDKAERKTRELAEQKVEGGREITKRQSVERARAEGTAAELASRKEVATTATMSSMASNLSIDDRSTIVCLHCAKPQDVPRNVVTIACKFCNKSLRLEDLRIKAYEARRVVETCGIVTVEREGNVVADRFRCGGLIVRGKVRANVLSRGPILIGGEAEVRGDVVAPTLASGAGAVLDGYYEIGIGKESARKDWLDDISPHTLSKLTWSPSPQNVAGTPLVITGFEKQHPLVLPRDHVVFRVIHIGKAARVHCISSECDTAIIEGELSGSITCRDRIQIEKSARVHADMSAVTATIEEGCVIVGHVSVGKGLAHVPRLQSARSPTETVSAAEKSLVSKVSSPPQPASQGPPTGTPSNVLGSRECVNSLGMKFVRIEPGEFLMGSPAREEGRSKDETQHTVKHASPFFLGAYLVTQKQWKALMGNNPSHFKAEDRPVEHVSWDDAVKFCRKLSQTEGKRYRLPTEAEWEYACRAGTTTQFNIGDGDEALNMAAWCNGNSGGETHPVGQKKPNAWGLYDMHGNVFEWCSDYFGSYATGIAVDPTGPGQGDRRVLRGGSWFYYAVDGRSASRMYGSPDGRNSYIGFRVVLDSP